MREVISRFGAQAKAKLANPGATGAPEDQLRALLEELIRSLAVESGMTESWDALVGGPPESLPNAMDYDPAARRLSMGRGIIDCVAPEVAGYEVSGRNVLRPRFSYRERDRTRPVIGDGRLPSPLDRIQPDHWLPEYTEDLLNLLHVLGRLVALEPAQAALLDEICAGPLLTAAALTEAGALAAPDTATGTAPVARLGCGGPVRMSGEER